jgi:hypothetical protein
MGWMATFFRARFPTRSASQRVAREQEIKAEERDRVCTTFLGNRGSRREWVNTALKDAVSASKKYQKTRTTQL